MIVNHLHLKGGMASNYFLTEYDKSNGTMDRYTVDSLFKFLERYSSRILEDEKEKPKVYLRKADALSFRYGSIPENPVKTDQGKLSAVHKNIESTDALILDIDHFESNISLPDVNVIIENWLGNTTRYFWWSTPSSSFYEPRVRIVIALNRNVTKEEYFDLQFRIPPVPKAIKEIDPSSFRLGQFFIMPCIINDIGSYCRTDIDDGYVSFDYEMHEGKAINVDKLPPAPLKSKIEHNSLKLQLSENAIKEVIESCINIINEAPSGEGYETTKKEVAKMFARYKIPLEYIEEMSSMIESPKRRKNFEGISKWIINKE